MAAYNITYDIENLGTVLESEIDKTDIRVVSKEGNEWRILYNNITYSAIIKKFDHQKKEAHLIINGFNYKIKVNEPIDHLINELGFLKTNKHSVKEIKSPMPGLVVNVFVEIGQQVSEGEKLISLEAMKMENIIKSPCDGIIKSILVNKGNAVEKNQIMITFE